MGGGLLALFKSMGMTFGGHSGDSNASKKSLDMSMGMGSDMNMSMSMNMPMTMSNITSDLDSSSCSPTAAFSVALLRGNHIISNRGFPVHALACLSTANQLQLPLCAPVGGELQVIVHSGSHVRLCLWTQADEDRLLAFDQIGDDCADNPTAAKARSEAEAEAEAENSLQISTAETKEDGGASSVTLLVSEHVEYKVVVMTKIDDSNDDPPQRFERFFCWSRRQEDPDCSITLVTFAKDKQEEVVSLDLLAALAKPLRV